MNVDIKMIEGFRAGTVRKVGPYSEVGPAFHTLASIAGPAGLFQKPGAAMLGIYHDDPATTAKEQLRADAAIVVADGVRLPDGLAELRVPGGRYACVTHIGPYESLPETWEQFMEWLPTSGHQRIDAPALEYYRNDPATVPPQELRTEICIAIA